MPTFCFCDFVAKIMALLTAAIVLLLAYFVGLAVYRLYFGPLAKFPGPKLAALSKWYEAYFEIVENGKFTFAIDRMHDRYGESTLQTSSTRYGVSSFIS